MELHELSITEPKRKQLARAGILTVEDLLWHLPTKHIDRSRITGIKLDETESVFLMRVTSVTRRFYSTTIVNALGVEIDSGREICVTWFNQAHIYDTVLLMKGKTVLVCGVVTRNNFGGKESLQVNAPAVFSSAGINGLRIYPEYKKVPGVSMEYLEKHIRLAASRLMPLEDTIPYKVRTKYQLQSISQMISDLHWPASQIDLDAAHRRKRWEDLLYFALRIELAHRSSAIGSPFNLLTTRISSTIRKNLPFTLTPDQAETLEETFKQIREGKRLNTLIQGDVGCGKTIIAFLLMVAFAENGYQAALMAPTQLLAKQHYEDLQKLVAPYGLEVAFISGTKLPKKEQKKLEDSIATGEIKLIVGTQALLSDTYTFNRLALIVEDEEHKYGVVQREKLVQKAAEGTHTVTMSATPIPRTLAQTIYGNHVQLYSILTKPSGRKPVTTGMLKTTQQLISYLIDDIKLRGHQAYAVCPMVSSNEKMQGVSSVEEIYEFYRKHLELHGIQVGMVTGKTKKKEAEQILSDFASGKISLLVSTTVIEVGINVPNATCIIIHNAERFGLAQLHQLRGRVGRGKTPGFCVLCSDDQENPRLEALCRYTDGFSVAEMDLQQRGAGDMIGIAQSGTERYLALALAHPEEYAKAQDAAKYILDSGEDCLILRRVLRDYQENKGGEMLDARI